MKALISTMFRFWCLLLGLSLGVAAVIYVFWLKDHMI